MWAAMGMGFGLAMYPLVFWFQHPELTQIQVFIEIWQYVISGFIMLFVGLWIFDKIK
jgi:hypothetical protein